MSRLLIVDDEILVRVGLRALVDWEAQGHAIVGEAASGDEALPLLVSLEPDIVLTDLVMGPGDGFSLIEAIRARSASTGIVVLSCRNDFDAVREAMRRGADDYLFKPTMKRDEILEVLDRVSEKRVTADAASPGGREAGPEEARLPPLSRLAAGGDCEASDLAAGMAAAGIKPDFFNAYRAALFALVPHSPGEGPDAASPDAFIQAVRELKRRGLPEFCVLPFAEGRVLVLMRGAYRDEPRAIADGIDEYARRYFGRAADGGVSGPARGIEALPAATAEAAAALSWRFFAGGGFHYTAELPPALPLDEDAVLRLGQAFKAAARSLDRPAMAAALDGLFEALRRAREAGPDKIRIAVWDFLAPLRERARSARVDIDGAAEAGGIPPQLAFLQGGDLAALGALARDYVSRAAERIAASMASRCRPEILRVIDALRGDIARNFTVEEAASLAAMSPSHFEHVFKREAGESFVRFVTKAKMERALELLASEDLKIYEIASSLGYENPNYFSTIFKQVVGLSPQEARESPPSLR
jgi:two-component system, response regulator YesN